MELRCLFILFSLTAVYGFPNNNGLLMVMRDTASEGNRSYIMLVEDDTLTALQNTGEIAVDLVLTEYDSYKRGIGFDYHDRLIFWNDVQKHGVYKMSDDDHVTTVYGATSYNVDALDVDWVNKKIYWTDSSYNWIMVSDYNGMYTHPIIVNDIDWPRGIAVHPGQGYLYWCDLGDNPKIEMAKLNGEDRQIIVDEEHSGADVIHTPHGLAIDFQENKLYWTEGGLDKIMSVTIDLGSYVVTEEYSGQAFILPFSIAINQNNYFVGDHWEQKLYIFNRSDPNIIKGFTISKRRPLGMSYYSEWRQQFMDGECTDNNGGCDQLCVGDPSGHRCLCTHGSILSSDGKTCSPDSHFLPGHHLVYSTSDSICSLPVHYATLSDVIHAECFITGVTAKYMDYDYHNDMLYYFDNVSKHIQRLKLREGENPATIVSNVPNTRGIAVNWMEGTLYWINSQAIFVSSVTGDYVNPVITDNIDQPRGIVVHPEKKLLFWADSGSLPRIEKSSLTGRQRKAFITSDLVSPTTLTIDHSKDRLYWIDAGSSRLESIGLDGQSRSIVLSDLNIQTQLTGLAIFQDHLYWTHYTSQQLLMYDHFGENYVDVKSLNEPAISLMVYDKTKQRLSTDSDCHSQNGGCVELCIPTDDGAECLCSEIPGDPNCVSVIRCPMHILHGKMSLSCVNTPGNKCYVRCDNYFIPITAEPSLCQSDGEWNIDTDTLCKLDAAMDHFMLVADSQGLIYHVNTLSPSERHIPLPLSDINNPIAVDYDPVENKLYWTDYGLNTVNRANMDGTEREIIASMDIEGITGLALDVVNRKVYWTHVGTSRIEYSNLDGSEVQSVITTGLGQPVSIVVDTHGSHIYWSVTGTNAKIERSNLDGSGRGDLVTTDIVVPAGLALDMKENKLYWADIHLKKIETFNLASNDRHILVSSSIGLPFALGVSDQYIYWSDWTTLSVHRADKYTGLNIFEVGQIDFNRPNGICMFIAPPSTGSTTPPRDIRDITTTSPRDIPPPTAGYNEASSMPMIIGGAGAGIVLLIIVIIVVVAIRRRRRNTPPPLQHLNEPVYADIDDLGINPKGDPGLYLQPVQSEYLTMRGDTTSSPPPPYFNQSYDNNAYEKDTPTRQVHQNEYMDMKN
ncbi:low-density lipoprotein receptor-related protein 5-like [Saccoglossus kowalevskii]|uniref:Low-density lipoprotein receptor-related protein 4-like n=1 Tax=Saccoglossus kowalevskii TaxID=10224 RepID=A0ABM0M1J7_SACKO|nr:PREDICTED: low-density lipoprotein receptor-related protein 4-like [Saccoglossus kowalevskii]